jgi:hypothetical protein
LLGEKGIVLFGLLLENVPSKKKAEKEAREWNKAYKGSDVKFLVRKEGWRRKRWWSWLCPFSWLVLYNNQG